MTCPQTAIEDTKKPIRPIADTRFEAPGAIGRANETTEIGNGHVLASAGMAALRRVLHVLRIAYRTIAIISAGRLMLLLDFLFSKEKRSVNPPVQRGNASSFILA